MPRIGSIALALILVATGLALLPDHALAQATGSVGNYSCSGGTASGQLFDSGAACPTSIDIDTMFSFLVCNMEQLSSNLMGNMYCGMITNLAPAVWAAATIAVMFFGVGILVGVIPATGRDAISFLLKIAFVTAFATNADYIIGYGYSLLIGGLRDGITVVLNGIGGTYTDGASVYKKLDEFLAVAFHYATDGVGATTGPDMCKNAIFAVMATMAVAFPLISYLGLLLIARITLTFLRAVFGYIYAIVGITFLLVLSPFFVTFYLFHVTRSFFDKWLGYLISFTLQMVILFSFIAFIFMLDVSSLVSNVSNIIVYDARTPEGTSFRMPWRYCTLCEFKVVDKNNTGTELTNKDANYLQDGLLQCKDSPPKPISIAFGASPPTGASPSNGPTANALIEFAGQGIMSLIVLAYVVDRVLKLLPSLAQKLASAMAGYAPQLGGGTNPTGVAVMKMPGDGLVNDFAKGYNAGVNRERNRNGVSTTAQGMKDGLSAMITGRLGSSGGRNAGDGTQAVDSTGQSAIGSRDRFSNFMADPTKWDDR